MFGKDNKANVVVIGGGTGLSVLLRGLKKKEAFDLSAVVTMADDGGNSGALREDLGMLPPGDVRSCLLALADEESVMQEVLRYRFTEGRLAGNSMGNLILAALNDIYGSFEQAVSKVSDILKVQGRVIPVSNEEIRLCAELANGSIVLGESNIPKVALKEGSPVEHVFLSPLGARASDAACAAVRDADLIMIGPGSLYTSIVPNFLALGISEALAESRGIKVYVANVMTQPGETDAYGIKEHFEVLCRYMGGGMPDYVIANNRELAADDLKPYISDGARQIIPGDEDRACLSAEGVCLIEDDFIETKVGYIRHDSASIAAVAERVLALKGAV